MRTGRKLFLILIVLLAVIAVFTIFIGDNDKNTFTAQLYFLNESSTDITPEERTIAYDDTDELPQKVIRELKKGPEDTKLHAFLSKDVKWTIEKSQSKLLVDFSKEFLTTDEKYNLLSSYAVVKSLCSIGGIGAVKLTVEGAEVILPDNTTIDYLTDKDINLESDFGATESVGVILYFLDENGMLKKEWRSIPAPDTTPLEQYVVSELVKGPKNTTLTAVLAADSQIISVELTDGIAYINVPESFILKNSGSLEKEKNAVYSIVNSLCELDGVVNVQFLVDGKKTVGFSNIDLTGLLSADYSMVISDTK